MDISYMYEFDFFFFFFLHSFIPLFLSYIVFNFTSRNAYLLFASLCWLHTFCRFTASSHCRNTANYHRFWFHTYLRWNVSPLCRFAAAARLPMLTSIQHFAIHRKCKSGEIIDLLACRFIAQRHRKRQGHVFCTFAQLNKMTSNSPQWRKCGEAAKVWSQH